VVIYNIVKIPALYVPVRHFFTHAWLPKDKFDEVVESRGWIFARKGEGYLALRSRNPYFWNEEKSLQNRDEIKKKFGFQGSWRENSEDLGREIIAPGKRNIWICQMGRKAEDGGFAGFMDKILAAQVIFKGQEVEYQSPGIGLVRFGWRRALSVDELEIPLRDYPRYGNSFFQAEFNASEISVVAGGHYLRMNWNSGEREPG